jgi:hypothetical protein
MSTLIRFCESYLITQKNRSNIAASILQNHDMLVSAFDSSAYDSEDSAQNELNSYMESLDAKISQFQNKVQQLESDLIDSDFLKGLVDAGTQLINILDLAIDKLGVLPTLIAPIAAFLSVKKNIGIVHKYANQLF